MLNASPRTLMQLLCTDQAFDEVVDLLGPQDDPREPEFVAEFGRLVKTLQSRSGISSTANAAIRAETWRALEVLERDRFTCREETEARTQSIVREAIARGEQVSKDQAVLAVGAFGVWCTARRQIADRGSAAKGLVPAIRIAGALSVDRLLAGLLQRAAHLLLEHEQLKPAEQLIDHALKLYLGIGDREGLGTALVDQGFVAFVAKDYQRAEPQLLLGAEFLGSSKLSHILKASAYQLAAESCTLRGELATAMSWLERATQFSIANAEQWASIRAHAGNLRCEIGLFEEAEAAYREALHIYLEADRVMNIVRVLLDLAMVKIAKEQLDEIPPLAKHLKPYLNQLPARDPQRPHVEEAYACLREGRRNADTLERFRKSFGEEWKEAPQYASLR